MLVDLLLSVPSVFPKEKEKDKGKDDECSSSSVSTALAARVTALETSATSVLAQNRALAAEVARLEDHNAVLAARLDDPDTGPSTTVAALSSALDTRLTAVEAFAEDLNQDGLALADELTLGCDPSDPDSDHDEVGDGAEVTAGTNRLHAFREDGRWAIEFDVSFGQYGSGPATLWDCDADGDGSSNKEELGHGRTSDPLDPLSF